MTLEYHSLPCPDYDYDLAQKLAKLRVSLATGAYRVPAEKIAEAMLKEHRLI